MAADERLLKIYTPSAYNIVGTTQILARWAHWCLNGSSRVYLQRTNDPVQTRVQQGDPLAPGSFSVGFQNVIELVKLLGIVMLAI